MTYVSFILLDRNMSPNTFYNPCLPWQIGNVTIFNIKMGVYLEKYGDSIMHTFLKLFSGSLYSLKVCITC